MALEQQGFGHANGAQGAGFQEGTNAEQSAPQLLASAGEHLASVGLGEPLTSGPVALFPLLSPACGAAEGPAAPALPYDLLSTALAAHHAEVTETGPGGTVPKLWLVNQGVNPILVPEGALLVGAKQNRVVDVTLLVAAGTQLEVPVSCVEQGRWAAVSRAFEDNGFASARVRAAKLEREQRTAAGWRRRDKQARVWEEVAAVHSDLAVESPTGDLRAAFAGERERLAEWRERLRLPAG
ncbi:MAG TPA: DUF6569 family protein, partial [Thermoanaerobaculia bacterium]|nr:DUF6569 family protein [Thermoanaerobaculia bacterium]